MRKVLFLGKDFTKAMISMISGPLCHLCMFVLYILYSIKYCLNQMSTRNICFYKEVDKSTPVAVIYLQFYTFESQDLLGL